jgi:hypothetical protein
MKQIFFTSLCVFLLSISLMAQKEETVFGYSGLRLTGIWGGPSSGTSNYGESNVFHNGGFIGLEFNNSIFLGWGWYKIRDAVLFPDLPPQNFNLNYSGFMLGVSALPNKVVHPKFSLLVGPGTYEFQFEGRDRLFHMQPAAGIEVNIFRWWHLSLEGGYRMAINSNYLNLSDSDLSAWFAELKFRFGFSWGW